MLESCSWFLLVPIWVSIIIMGAKFLGISIHKKYIVGLSVLSTIFSSIYCLYGLYFSYLGNQAEFLISFVKIGSFNFQLGVYVDLLNSLLGLTISIITFAIYIYSIFYMDKEKSFSRYYSLMNIFNSGILAFIFSPNLFQMFLFWEIIGVISYFLIGFWYQKNTVSLDAKRVFLINTIGDICLFAAFIIISFTVCFITNNMNLVSLPFSELNIITSAFYGATSPIMYKFVLLLLIIAAVVKSAQFPINSWLINAMSAPTPVSALIHSSTLVCAGVFLLMRLFPMIALDNQTIYLVGTIGIITALVTSLSALVQTNIKKVLAYSTSAQIGLVFLSIGCYNPILGIIYMISHASIKALLFMCAGVVIKLVNNKNIMFMGEFRKCTPIVALCFLVGAISLSGLGFCGFNTKSLLTEAYCSSIHSILIFAFIGALTALYIFRLYFFVFENTASYECENLECSKQNSLCKSAYFTLIFMAIIVILLSLATPNGQICPLYIINLIMVLLAWYFYNTKFKLKRLPFMHHILTNGFYINKIYYWGEIYLYKYFSYACLFVDKYILGGIEKLMVWMISSISNREITLQSNYFQSYIFYGIWIIIILMVVFSTIYLFILNLFGV